MSWIYDHLILLAALLLIVLVIAGLVVLVLRALGLFREAKRSQARVDPHVSAISGGLNRAERRLGQLQERQVDLTQAVEQVGKQATELQWLLGTAGKALTVLRAPLKYFGK